MKTLKIKEKHLGVRLDKLISKIYDISRTKTDNLFNENKVLVNGEKVLGKYLPKLDDLVTIEEVEAKPLDLEAQNLNIEIVYEDEDVAVVYKPSGMVVHPGSGNAKDTLVNGLLSQMEFEDSINDVLRPGIVHRIDKDTSGLLMIAKNDLAVKSLQEQLKEHSSNRIYVALVYGVIQEDKGRIDAPIGRSKTDRKKMDVVAGGKEAVTNFKVLERFKDYTLIECKLETGRTHQIRVHMKYIGHPLVGDKVYGPKHVIGDNGQFLHAKTIGFNHPRTNKYLEFSHELPKYFEDFLNDLRINNK